jgi:thioredoxin reductase (NADPH)
VCFQDPRSTGLGAKDGFENIMLTAGDIGVISVFSSLAPAELERLARTSADIQLNPGEFAVHEGEERALFAVLTGKIEVIKTDDGVERRLGWRNPGAIFGEVPIVLGTPFPGGYRAVEPSRVMRIDVQEYYAIAAASRDFSEKVSALARERLGRLQSLAAKPSKPRVTLIGPRWDAASGGVGDALAWASPTGRRRARAFACGRTGHRPAERARCGKSARPSDQCTLR